MKKRSLMIVAGLLGLALMAQAQEVRSVNTVGFYKVPVLPGGKLTLAALQFNAIDPANQNLLGVFGVNNLRQSAVPGPADKVFLWDTGQAKWNQYFQKTNGLFYVAASPFNVVTNPAMFVGEGFFIQSPTTATGTNMVTFAGEVVDVATQTLSIVGANALQTLGYPFSDGTSLAAMSLTQQGTAGVVPGPSDKVFIYDSTLGYIQYWLKQQTPRHWYKATDLAGVNPQDPPIAMGQGFWYQGKAAFTWSETNKYLNNL